MVSGEEVNRHVIGPTELSPVRELMGVNTRG